MTFAPHNRTHCLHCGAPRHAHEWETARCIDLYRPDTLGIARRALAEAEESGDEARIFVARGDLQRLQRR